MQDVDAEQYAKQYPMTSADAWTNGGTATRVDSVPLRIFAPTTARKPLRHVALRLGDTLVVKFLTAIGALHRSKTLPVHDVTLRFFPEAKPLCRYKPHISPWPAAAAAKKNPAHPTASQNDLQ
jgi:hypothetical protein